MKLTYKYTLVSSYLAYITQAEVNNLLPLLFVTLSEQFDIAITQIGTLIVLNFGVQIITDIAATWLVDIIGLRTGAVFAHACSALGLASLGVLPFVLPPFAGVALSVILSAIGSGLCEVVVSPIVEGLPLKRKAAHMTLLHSFYSWGYVLVVLLSTFYFMIVGVDNWRFLPMLWAILPAINTVMFTFLPVYEINSKTDEKINLKELLSRPYFLIMLVLMLCGGASEVCLSQWASYFAETGLHVSKTVGDLLGPCSFALMMGVSRVFYARFAKRINLLAGITVSSALCVVSYLLASLSPIPMLALLSCALCGLSVGLMWPGIISLSAAKFKKAGGAMFALLALAGDIGCTSAPWLTSLLAERTGSLQTGLLLVTVFPAVMLLGCIKLKLGDVKNVR